MPSIYKTIPSPVGKLTLIANNKGLTAILWENDDFKRTHTNANDLIENQSHPLLLTAEQQLKDYFAGQRKTFSIPLDFIGTEFQKKVWQALLTIPFGETRSYGHIAKQINNPKAVRAVGAANRKNPISIIAPCHRVIGSNGKLVGFAGGLAAKAYLLDLESNK